MSYITYTTPEFPVISWQVTLPSTAVNVTYDGNTYSGDIPAGDYWGFAQSTAFVSNADSLAAALAAVVEAVMQDAGKHNYPSFDCIGYLEEAGNHEYRIRLLTVDALATDIQIVIDAGATETFGALSTVTIDSGTGSGRCQVACDGFWRPRNLTVYDDRRDEAIAMQSIPAYALNTTVVQWGLVKQYRLLQFPHTYVAYIYDYRRELDVFADVAQLDRLSPNNLLTGFLQAARDEKDFRIYQDFDEYRLARYVGDGISDSSKIISDISARGAMYSVDLLFIDGGDDGTGAI